jgi:magnesium-protoporphyrin O-methyltransferase
MGCCQCNGIEKIFNTRYVDRELRAYRERGPGSTTRTLIDALSGIGVRGLTLLDVGGGVGAIHHELLKAGLEEATDVDASSTYLAAAKNEALRQGHAERVTYHHGNFVDLADRIKPADIVTLDRVICCYDDMPRLVHLSAERALRYYALAFPREAPWVRLGICLENLWQGVRRSTYRVFVHSTRAVEAILLDHGLHPVTRVLSPVWQVKVYARRPR